MPTPTEQIDAFCDQVWLQDGLAPSSLASYRRDLTQWAAWLGRRGSSLLAAQRTDVESFLAEQFRAKAKATSIARRLSSLRRFYALQLLQGTLRADPTLRVRAPKLPRRLPKNLSEAQVEALLAAPDTRDHPRPARPRDAGDALRDRPCACPSSSASRSRRCRSTWASCACSARAARSGSSRSARNRSPGSSAISPTRGRRSSASGKNATLFVTARRGAAHAAGVLGADRSASP